MSNEDPLNNQVAANVVAKYKQIGSQISALALVGAVAVVWGVWKVADSAVGFVNEVHHATAAVYALEKQHQKDCNEKQVK